MKKIFLCFSAIMLAVIPLATQAAAIAPYHYLKIITNTLGGDGTFMFTVANYELSESFSNSIDISTQSGTGQYTYSPPNVGSGNHYFFTESLQPGWSRQGIVCTNDQNGPVGLPLNGGMVLPYYSYTTTTCIVTNQKTATLNPILIVPGIMGTEIDKGTELLWPDLARMANPFHSDDFMDPLSYQSNGLPVDTSLSIGSVLTNPDQVFDYSEKLQSDLIAAGYVQGLNLFTFPYDWRRDIQQVAEQDDPQMLNPSLRQTIDNILASTGAQKISIIAHSQGGLVVKRLLMDVPQYQSKIDKLVFVGVPNLGAPKAAKVLLYGDDMDVNFAGLGLDPLEVQKIAQNMPAVYQLLPGSEYFNHAAGYIAKGQPVSPDIPVLHITNLSATATVEYLKDQNLNSALIDDANNFHSESFDNFDLSTTGITAYNIVGCQAGTLGKIISKPDGDYNLQIVAGDGTVPLISGVHIPGAATYYALQSSHGLMLTQDGIRKLIVNVMTGGVAANNSNISQNISDCKFNGTAVSAHSPVRLDVYDSQGRHLGPVSGGFDSQIPNADYETIGHDSFAYLPDGGIYTVQLTATGAGNFSFDASIFRMVKSSVRPTMTTYQLRPVQLPKLI